MLLDLHRCISGVDYMAPLVLRWVFFAPPLMTTIFLDNCFCHGVCQEKQLCWTIFLSAPNAPLPLKNANFVFIVVSLSIHVFASKFFVGSLEDSSAPKKDFSTHPPGHYSLLWHGSPLLAPRPVQNLAMNLFSIFCGCFRKGCSAKHAPPELF